MTEKERVQEIERLTKGQLSHATDLPRSKRIWIKGKRISFREIPYSPDWVEGFATSTGKVQVPQEGQHTKSLWIPKGDYINAHPLTYLPQNERTYVLGREHTFDNHKYSDSMPLPHRLLQNTWWLKQAIRKAYGIFSAFYIMVLKEWVLIIKREGKIPLCQ